MTDAPDHFAEDLTTDCCAKKFKVLPRRMGMNIVTRNRMPIPSRNPIAYPFDEPLQNLPCPLPHHRRNPLGT